MDGMKTSPSSASRSTDPSPLIPGIYPLVFVRATRVKIYYIRPPPYAGTYIVSSPHPFPCLRVTWSLNFKPSKVFPRATGARFFLCQRRVMRPDILLKLGVCRSCCTEKKEAGGSPKSMQRRRNIEGRPPA